MVAHGLTAARVVASVPLAVAAFRRRRSVAAWAAAIVACTVCDWVDGPLARRAGTASAAGARFDIEADSWLTLWTAVASWRTGGLGAWCVAPAVVRYAVVAARPGGRHDRWRDRAVGAAQMAVLLGGLAPWARVRGWARVVGPAVAVAQVVVLVRGARPGGAE